MSPPWLRPFLFAPLHSCAAALPVTFTDFNVSTSNQSRINIAATATLSGTPLTEGPQFAAGGLNGDGSESSLYNQTTSNTPSNMGTNLGLFSIGFPGDSESQAANATGLLGNNLAIAPGVGGVSGTAPRITASSSPRRKMSSFSRSTSARSTFPASPR